MDEQNIMEEEQPRQPRPMWQRVGALIGIAILIVGFLLYCWQIANGGR